MDFRLGLENFLSQDSSGKTGIITNLTGVDQNLELNIDLLIKKGTDLKVIFAPEHGFYGAYKNGEEVPDESYQGIPIKSLYGNTKKTFTKEDLEGLDSVIFDIQDAGARPYTFLSTLHNLMKAAKNSSVVVKVLDRPDPIGAELVEGPMLESEFVSFVGTDEMPLRYGMTVGELAQYFNRKLDISLDVVKMAGYQRKLHYYHYANQFIPPSMNLNSPTSVFNFPGFVLLEACRMSLGRGTPYPFVQFGYPGIWDLDLKNIMGAKFRKVMFSPYLDPLSGKLMEGFYTHIDNPEKYDGIVTAMKIMKHLYSLDPENVDFRHLHLLYGSRSAEKILEEDIKDQEMKNIWDESNREFMEERRHYTLY